MVCRLSVQLLLTFMLFLLKTLWYWWIFRKMFTDEVQKLSADVCLHVHAVGRITPNYVSLSVLAEICSSISGHSRVT